MRVRRLDHRGDWTFGAGRSNYADTSESVAQRVSTRLRSFRGNWFLDLDHGLPWLEMMQRPADLVRLEREVKHSILNTPGVHKITGLALRYDADTRRLNVQVTLVDIYQHTATVSTEF